jgi:hypothetical protein
VRERSDASAPARRHVTRALFCGRLGRALSQEAVSGCARRAPAGAAGHTRGGALRGGVAAGQLGGAGRKGARRPPGAAAART